VWIRRFALAVVLLGLAAASAEATATKAGGPANTGLPAISGTPQVGAGLTGSPGSWSGMQPISYAYQWQRCNATGGACGNVPGATGTTDILAAADLGKTLRLRVTAKNPAGSQAATSAATAVVAPPPPVAPANTSPPAIAGAATVGQTLTASPGSWSGTAPIAYTYQWESCDATATTCAPTADATSASYVVQPGDGAGRLEVLVTTTNAAGSATAVSAPTGLVPTGPPAPPVPGFAWQLRFADEFTSPPDTSRWVTCYWWTATPCAVTDDHELQLYNADDVYTQDGRLRLRARQAALTGPGGATFAYGSGMVSGGGRPGAVPPGYTFTYGYAEARLWMPAGKGLWPAFWMLPASYDDRHEIDVVELTGDAPTAAEFHLHASGVPTFGKIWRGPDFSTGWHTFGLDWEPASLTWYVDGVARATYTGAGIPQEPMYLILNLAVGGDWPGTPDASTVFPAYLDADWVRVWQHP
jgi:beta-glucanase (GH16 family)